MNKIIGLFVLILVSTVGRAQEDIDFTYQYNRDDSNPNLVNVTAKIFNNSENDTYFLSESCNGLDSYLSTNTESAEIFIIFHCNATYPRKIELKANSSFEFKTTIKLNGSIEQLGLNLKLVRLTKSAEVEGKFIGEIRKENTQRTLNLVGPIIKIAQ